MKKILLISLLSALFSLACCAKESSSIGIIGGADGPTAIMVSQNLPMNIIVLTAVIVFAIIAIVFYISNKK